MLYQLSYLGANPNLGQQFAATNLGHSGQHRRFASPGIVPGSDLSDNFRRFAYRLQALNLSPRTVPIYVDAAERFEAYLRDEGGRLVPADAL